MPIYEYRCESCGHELDAIQKLADAPLVDCPQCGQPALRKLISAPAFRLKGSGWYETDFKTDKKKNLHEGSGAAESGNAGGKAAQSESAPAAKTESTTAAAASTASASVPKASTPTPAAGS